MACKPRRRRHNKHNLSVIHGTKPDGTIVVVPRSRKAFKVEMRNDNSYNTHDFAIIKRKLYGVEIGDMVYLPAEVKGDYIFNDKSRAGYYSVNSKGPVKLTGALLEQAKKLKQVEREARQAYQA